MADAVAAGGSAPPAAKGSERGGQDGRVSVADRMNRIPTSPHTALIIFFVLMGWFAETIDLGGTSFLMPAIREYFGMDATTGGYYSSICFFGMFFGAIAAGRIADKVGRKKTIVASMLIWGVAGFALVFSPNVYYLFAMRFVLGLGLGAQFPVALSYLSEIVSGKDRPKFMTLYQLMTPVGFAVAGVLCLIGFVMVVALVKNRPGESAAKDPDNARRTVLESIMKRDVYTLPANATVAEAMQVLMDRHISAAPLVDEQGKAVGFVSDGDIMRYLSKRSQMLMDPVVMIMQTVDADGGNKDFARKLDELMGMPAKSIGAKGIIGVDVHADLPEVCRVLGENHLKKVPVLDEGQVVGVINRSDITHYSMQQYLAERDAEAASKLERSEEAAALPDDEAMASSI